MPRLKASGNENWFVCFHVRARIAKNFRIRVFFKKHSDKLSVEHSRMNAQPVKISIIELRHFSSRLLIFPACRATADHENKTAPLFHVAQNQRAEIFKKRNIESGLGND